MSESDWAVSAARDRAEQITAMRAAGVDVGVRPLRRLNEELMSAPPAIALQLGVRGVDEFATEQRRFLADKLQWLAVADFAQAHGQVAALEPSAPFGLALIRAHRGDLAGALASPYATTQMKHRDEALLRQRMGAGPGRMGDGTTAPVGHHAARA